MFWTGRTDSMLSTRGECLNLHVTECSAIPWICDPSASFTIQCRRTRCAHYVKRTADSEWAACNIITAYNIKYLLYEKPNTTITACVVLLRPLLLAYCYELSILLARYMKQFIRLHSICNATTNVPLERELLNWWMLHSSSKYGDTTHKDNTSCRDCIERIDARRYLWYVGGISLWRNDVLLMLHHKMGRKCLCTQPWWRSRLVLPS